MDLESVPTGGERGEGDPWHGSMVAWHEHDMDGSPRADQPDHTQAHAPRTQEGTWEDTATDGEWTAHEWLEWRMATAEQSLNEHGEDIRGLWEAVNALNNRAPQPWRMTTG